MKNNKNKNNNEHNPPKFYKLEFEISSKNSKNSKTQISLQNSKNTGQIIHTFFPSLKILKLINFYTTYHKLEEVRTVYEIRTELTENMFWKLNNQKFPLNRENLSLNLLSFERCPTSIKQNVTGQNNFEFPKERNDFLEKIDPTRVFISMFPLEIKKRHLFKAFGKYGKINQIKIFQKKIKKVIIKKEDKFQKSRFCQNGYVEFESSDNAQNLIEERGIVEVNGVIIKCSYFYMALGQNRRSQPQLHHFSFNQQKMNFQKTAAKYHHNHEWELNSGNQLNYSHFGGEMTKKNNQKNFFKNDYYEEKKQIHFLKKNNFLEGKKKKSHEKKNINSNNNSPLYQKNFAKKISRKEYMKEKMRREKEEIRRKLKPGQIEPVMNYQSLNKLILKVSRKKKFKENHQWENLKIKAKILDIEAF